MSLLLWSSVMIVAIVFIIFLVIITVVIVTSITFVAVIMITAVINNTVFLSLCCQKHEAIRNQTYSSISQYLMHFFLSSSVNCWPSENDGQCDVNIEYELLQENLELNDVIISIPVP